MAEVVSQQPAATPVSYLTDAPVMRTLEDGTKLLAEATAYLILESNVHTSKCGAYANEHTVQLIREHTDSKGQPGFKLVVQPRAGEAGDVEHVVVLDTRCSMSPALRKLRREVHFVKPDGESLMRAINRMDGEEIKLFAFEVRRGNPNPLLNLLRLKQSVVRLGFKTVEEALGWYGYIAACATIMSEHDPDFKKVIKPEQGLAEHAAAPHALMLDFD